MNNVVRPDFEAVKYSIFNSLFKTFDLKIGSLTISPNYLMAGAILILLFLLIYMMAHMRHLFIKWSFKGAGMGVLVGFFLALVLEGFFIVGGSTMLTTLLGWKTAPKPLQNALDAGRSEMIKVLGVETECKN
ncbi:MAG: hypothetical protein AAB656_02975 [Patescibacteria group bacterium]